VLKTYSLLRHVKFILIVCFSCPPIITLRSQRPSGRYNKLVLREVNWFCSNFFSVQGELLWLAFVLCFSSIHQYFYIHSFFFESLNWISTKLYRNDSYVQTVSVGWVSRSENVKNCNFIARPQGPVLSYLVYTVFITLSRDCNKVVENMAGELFFIGLVFDRSYQTKWNTL